MTWRKLLVVFFSIGLITASGCSSGSDIVVKGDGEQIRKDKEAGGKKALEPIPASPRRTRQIKGSNGMDSSL